MYPLGCSLCRKTHNIVEDAEAQGAVDEVDLDDDEAAGYELNADYQYYNPLNEYIVKPREYLKPNARQEDPAVVAARLKKI